MRFAVIFLVSLGLILSGCSTYKPTVTPFKLPEAYHNMQRVADTYIGARAWTDVEAARAAFGFNILGAGLLPVQVSFDNRGNQTLVIVPSQTYLINQTQEYFPILSDTQAYDRVAKGVSVKETVKGLTEGTLLVSHVGSRRKLG